MVSSDAVLPRDWQNYFGGAIGMLGGAVARMRSDFFGGEAGAALTSFEGSRCTVSASAASTKSTSGRMFADST